MRRLKLVLLCGLLCDQEIWRDVVAELKSCADIRIFSFPDFSSIGAMADHVLGAVPGRFAIAGHSMGGRAALEIARKAPERVSGLALLNTGIHPPGEREPTERARLVELARQQGMKALAAAWLPPMLGSELDPSDALFQRLESMVQRSTPDSFASQIQALLHRPAAKDVIATTELPVHLISATQDRWSPPAQHEVMRRLSMTADLSIVEHAGHMAPIEQPVAVASALKPWIARVVAFEDEPPLGDTERLMIERECTRQIVRASRLTDEAAFDALSEKFAEDGTLARPSDPDMLIRGRAAILQSFRARPPRVTRHIVSNVEVVVETRSQARARSSILLFSAGPETGGAAPIEAMAIGTFHDKLTRQSESWLFQERRGYITMKSSSTERHP